MTASQEPEATIDYAALMLEALRGVVRRALGQAAAEGLPGEHHFYLTFCTTDPGVELAPRLRQQFPKEMTIVLQHQYWNLSVDETGFAVTLRFAGTPERLVVPWTALVTFADPGASFGLRLRAEEGANEEAGSAAVEPISDPAARPEADGPAAVGTSAPPAAASRKVVDFGAFRNRST